MKNKTDKIIKWLMSNINNYPNKKACFTAGAKKFNKDRRSIENRYYNHIHDKGTIPAPKKVVQGNGGISEAQLRSRFDIAFIVDQVVSKLEKGVYIPESEFIVMADIRHITGFRTILESEKYDKYKGKGGSVVYWSHPDSIQKMKEEHVLR